MLWVCGQPVSGKKVSYLNLKQNKNPLVNDFPSFALWHISFQSLLAENGRFKETLLLHTWID